MPASFSWWIAIFLAAHIATALNTTVAKSSCVFNSTHCSCRLIDEPGACLRKSGLDCLVDKCSGNGFTCDCSGTTVCKIKTCNAWVSSTSISTSLLPFRARVPCRLTASSHCLEQDAELKVLMPRPEPTEYRIVQFGKASPLHLFNMSAFVDEGDFISNQYAMHGNWKHSRRLRSRFTTMRMYDSADLKTRMLCAIFNTFGIESDGLGKMSVRTVISGASGQTLTWAACDDVGECRGKSGRILHASHLLASSQSDGWCVKQAEWNGNAISVTFSDVNGMLGVVLQSPAGQDQDYLFSNSAENGMTGTVDSSGLVQGGATPAITFRLSGIEVPATRV